MLAKNETLQLIVSDPAMMMGKRVVKGTRIRVELILEKLAAGETVEQISEAHPPLTREGIQSGNPQRCPDFQEDRPRVDGSGYFET